MTSDDDEIDEEMREHLFDTLLSCVSGQELAQRGFVEDLRLAAELDPDGVAPGLLDEGFRSPP